MTSVLSVVTVITMKNDPDKKFRDRRDKIRGHYEPRISSLRENYDILDWASAHTQEARFAVLPRFLDLTGKSLLDVGCGLGDLLTYFERHKLAVDYTGVDILPAMVQAASERHPHGRFICGDVFQASPFGPGSFDVVFCSGTFNLNLGNNMEFLPDALARFFELSRRYVVFNLLHKRSASFDLKYFHYDPDEVLAMLKPLNCHTHIVDDYLPNDFTVLCEKA